MFYDAPHHKNVWEMEAQLHEFLISALDGGEWLASCPGRTFPGKEASIPSG
jgi:hypothetical protein